MNSGNTVKPVFPEFFFVTSASGKHYATAENIKTRPEDCQVELQNRQVELQRREVELQQRQVELQADQAF